MPDRSELWDYLFVTAANEQQAASYESLLQLRRENGGLPEVRHVLVAPDAGGRRIGSGGSTIQCLREVLRREAPPQTVSADPQAAEAVLRRLRVLIVHGGGDSRRLPAYSPCGKIFVPLPGEASFPFAPTLFDRLVPAFLALSPGLPGAGQVVVAAGDALILFDASEARFSRRGIIALGARVPPEEAARHGVYCTQGDGAVRLYLQKPSVAEQMKAGAIGADGQSVLDIGVMSFDAAAASRLLRAFSTPSVQEAVLSHGIDLYREICCALGAEATFAHYLAAARASGSRIAEPLMAELFGQLRSVPLSVETLRECSFLHFGSTRQLIASGIELVTRDRGFPPVDGALSIANEIQPGGRLDATESWVEGCRLSAPLKLHGRNVIVGVDVDEPFELPMGTCLDVSPGLDRRSQKAWFIRYYGVNDTFKDALAKGGTFCGQPLARWLSAAGVSSAEVWDSGSEQTLWNARVFPAEKDHHAYRRWRWMLDAENADSEQKRMFLTADRYSAAEIALQIDHAAFSGRRAAIRAAGGPHPRPPDIR